MTRARQLSKLGNANVLSVDSSNNVGMGSLTPDAKLDVVGIVSATSFSGSGANLTGIVAGATLSAGSGAQRVVATGLTSGTMTAAATDADLSWNSSTNTLSAPTLSGNITGTAATFSGSVSVGGTLTHGDVTNVDSVGVVTARSGIKVGAGESISPVSGTLTYYGDGSNLTGVELGTKNFVASGTIDNGATVVLNTDGTVGIVTQTALGPSAGDATTFVTNQISGMSCVFDTTNNKVVIAYQDQGNSNYGTVVIGTVSGDTISFGTPVVFNSAGTWYTSMSFIPGGKVVIFYYDNGNSDGRAIVGTVSGTSISFGTHVQFATSYTEDMGSCYDSSSAKVVVTYRDVYASTNNSGWARVGTVSGTSISFGTAVQFKNDHVREMARATVYIGSSKVVIGYRDWNNSHYGTAIVGTVSGTSISFGSDAVFNSAQTSNIAMSWDENAAKIVAAYVDGGQSWKGSSCVGTVSGTSISFGTEVMFETGGQVDYCESTYDPDEMKTVVIYNAYGGGGLSAVIGTVSGTSISWGSRITLQTHHAGNGTPHSTYDTNANKTVVAYTGGTPNYGRGFVLKLSSTTTNLTTENYIGIAGEAIANAATGKISVVGGVNSGQSGLTTAKTYYVAPTGILTTTAGTPSVVAGTSISDTKILVWRS